MYRLSKEDRGMFVEKFFESEPPARLGITCEVWKGEKMMTRVTSENVVPPQYTVWCHWLSVDTVSLGAANKMCEDLAKQYGQAIVTKYGDPQPAEFNYV